MGIALTLPSLLHRAGFTVDMIAHHPFLSHSKFISNYYQIPEKNMIRRLSEMDMEIYDFIIPSDDYVLFSILNADLPIEKKSKILPVTGEKYFGHICSKIKLSEILAAGNINTPEFARASDFSEALEAMEKIGYPALVKVDHSNGGNGIFECKNRSDLYALDQEIFTKPVLVQKLVDGVETDLSAVYRDGQLLHFSHAEVDKVTKKFGPSIYRTYTQAGALDEELFSTMERLGKTIGANGFVTISSIRSTEDNSFYFIEADMRPNVWAQYAKFIGDDPADRIKAWFVHRERMTRPVSINENYPEKLKLPYFMRMSIPALLCNRCNVWKYTPREDPEPIRIMLANKFHIAKLRRKIKGLKSRRYTNGLYLQKISVRSRL